MFFIGQEGFAPSLGFAARCEARLCLAVTVTEVMGLRPRFGLWPINTRGKARTGGAAHWQSKVERRGVASPHIGRRSRSGWNQVQYRRLNFKTVSQIRRRSRSGWNQVQYRRLNFKTVSQIRRRSRSGWNQVQHRRLNFKTVSQIRRRSRSGWNQVQYRRLNFKTVSQIRRRSRNNECKAHFLCKAGQELEALLSEALIAMLISSRSA